MSPVLSSIDVVDGRPFAAATTLGAVRRKAVSLIDPADESPATVALARDRQLVREGAALSLLTHESIPANRGVPSHPATASAWFIE